MTNVVRDELTTSTPDSIPKQSQTADKINLSITIPTCLDCGKTLSRPDAIHCQSCKMKYFWKNKILIPHPGERKPILPGTEFHGLTVIKFHHKLARIYNNKKRYLWYYLCKCVCGKELLIEKDQLTQNKRMSCGCLYAKIKGIANRKEKYESSFNMVYGGYKTRTTERKIEFLLSKKEFKFLTSQPCFYCGTEPNQYRFSHEKICYGVYKYNGLDRIDSKNGYVKNNVVPCCKYCNVAKNDLSSKEFYQHIEKMYNYLREKKWIK